MKAIKITLNNREFYLYFNGEAMFEVQGMYGETPIFDVLMPSDKTAFTELCNMLALLSTQGELARRQLGYDKRPMLTAEDAALFITPMEVMPLKLAVLQAVAIGYGREIEGNQDAVDLVLAEIEKKEEPA